MTPLAIDLFCGLGGWTEGLLAEGYRVVGFDIERHVYGQHRYPAQLVLQDALTIHGSQFKHADLIVASPPCQEYSYMAMPWSIAKQKAADYRAGVRDVKQLTALFDACFRIQREASEAAGRHIPMVVENVRGAQEWVGRSRFHFGSFHLWGDVPALMPITRKAIKVPTMGAGWYPPEHPKHTPGLAFNGHADRLVREGQKNPGFRFDGSGKSFQSESVKRNWDDETIKGVGIGSRSWHQGAGQRHPNDPRNTWSKSPARKYASAMIAKIPLVLARFIAHTYHPNQEGQDESNSRRTGAEVRALDGQARASATEGPPCI